MRSPRMSRLAGWSCAQQLTALAVGVIADLPRRRFLPTLLVGRVKTRGQWSTRVDAIRTDKDELGKPYAGGRKQWRELVVAVF